MEIYPNFVIMWLVWSPFQAAVCVSIVDHGPTTGAWHVLTVQESMESQSASRRRREYLCASLNIMMMVVLDWGGTTPLRYLEGRRVIGSRLQRERGISTGSMLIS